MTKQKQSERDAAVTSLRETLKPGDTVYTVLRSVSRSGMNRKIDVYALKCENGEVEKYWLSRLVSKATGETFDAKRDALSVSGCGMDMGFHVVYNLSRVLFRDGFKCCGKDCPANDHNNAWSSHKQGQCIVCRGQLPLHTDPSQPVYMRRNGEDSQHEYRVCSEQCATGDWIHSDPGYALKHKWL